MLRVDGGDFGDSGRVEGKHAEKDVRGRAVAVDIRKKHRLDLRDESGRGGSIPGRCSWRAWGLSTKAVRKHSSSFDGVT